MKEVHQVTSTTIDVDCDELEDDPIMHCALGFTFVPDPGGGLEQAGRVMTLLQDRMAGHLSASSASDLPSGP